MNRLPKVLFILLLLGNIASAIAEGMPAWDAETLSGDWGGIRSMLSDRGITVELTHKSDTLANTSGGIKRGSVWLANSEAAVCMDMGKLAGWDATTVFIQYHVQHGDQPKDFNGSYVGSFAGVDNIETGTATGQFFQAWLQKNSADESLSVLAGLYAIDSEFYVTDSSGLFIQPPYGMSAEMAQTGKNGPPVFPVGALALRMKYTGSGYYVQGALTDGVPGDPDNPRGTHIKLGNGDGTLSIVELGYAPSPEGEEEQFNKTSVGFWRYTAPAADLVTGEPRSDRGFYFLAERTLRAVHRQSDRGLAGFVRVGTANRSAYRADWSGSVGLNYHGLFDARDEDEAGVALTTSHASSKYRQVAASDSSEVVVEITYRAQLRPWVAVQPTLQRIVNPGMDKSLRNASVAGVRIEIVL